MSAVAERVPGRLTVLVAEAAKLPAFLRRDLLIAWSYRLSFVSEWLGLALQAIMFAFISKLVDPSALPSFDGRQPTYMEFVAVGIALSAFVQLALSRVSAGLRAEQMTGTLESLLMTPTAPATIQLGTVVYDVIYVPIRTALFLVATALVFGLDFEPSGLLPALVVLLAFIPFVWGLGVASAGAILTFKRGAGGAGFAVTLITLFSGAFFPLDLLPGWAQTIAELNPVAVVVEGMRVPLLAGADWGAVALDLAVLLPVSAASLAAGTALFRLALRREKARGSLALY
jgi:ABC-2 type transport system permease protein